MQQAVAELRQNVEHPWLWLHVDDLLGIQLEWQHPKPGRANQTIEDRKATCSWSSCRVPWVHYLSLAAG